MFYINIYICIYKYRYISIYIYVHIYIYSPELDSTRSHVGVTPDIWLPLIFGYPWLPLIEIIFY